MAVELVVSFGEGAEGSGGACGWRGHDNGERVTFMLCF